MSEEEKASNMVKVSSYDAIPELLKSEPPVGRVVLIFVALEDNGAG